MSFYRLETGHILLSRAQCQYKSDDHYKTITIFNQAFICLRLYFFVPSAIAKYVIKNIPLSTDMFYGEVDNDFESILGAYKIA